MIYIVNINDKVYEVEVEKGKANLIKTTNVEVQVPKIETVVTDCRNTVNVASSDNFIGEAVKSPMPGSILDIKVDVGSKVKKGQLLIVLEAMKMENEIFSPSDGVVTQIIVAKGSTVSANDNLIVIQ